MTFLKTGFVEATDSTETQNTSNVTFVQKLSVTTPKLATGGKYRVGIVCEYSATNTNRGPQFQVITGAAVLVDMIDTADASNSFKEWDTNVTYTATSSAPITITFQFRVSTAGATTLTVRNARLTFNRIG